VEHRKRGGGDIILPEQLFNVYSNLHLLKLKSMTSRRWKTLQGDSELIQLVQTRYKGGGGRGGIPLVENTAGERSEDTSEVMVQKLWVKPHYLVS
jgi:hypothetical protein